LAPSPPYLYALSLHDALPICTTALSIVASFAVGIIMFAAPVFLGQYFQIGRGHGPAASGLLMGPMMLGVFLASTIAGRLVSRRRSEEHTSELQSRENLVCRLL